MAEDKKKEVKERYSLGSVVTGTSPAILLDEKPLTLEEALVELLNAVDKLNKNLG